MFNVLSTERSYSNGAHIQWCSLLRFERKKSGKNILIHFCFIHHRDMHISHSLIRHADMSQTFNYSTNTCIKSFHTLYKFFSLSLYYIQLFDCRNHIRVLQPMEGNRLYICGTYAHNPKDYIIFVSNRFSFKICTHMWIVADAATKWILKLNFNCFCAIFFIRIWIMNSVKCIGSDF